MSIKEMDEKLDNISKKLGIDHILDNVFWKFLGQAQRNRSSNVFVISDILQLLLADEPTET